MNPLRRLSAGIPAVALALSMLPTTACKPGKNLAGAVAKTPDGSDALTGAKCSVKASTSRPLTVDWDGMDRAALERRAAGGLVPVRYTGCEIELLNNCKIENAYYEYLGLTPRRQTETIKDFDELYAKIPIGAAKLEAKLERAGALFIDMYIAGSHAAPHTDKYTEHDLAGGEDECVKRATHVITGIQVGAFTFTAGASAEIGGGAEVQGVGGAGAKSGAEKERINSGGDFSACAASEPGSTEAPLACNEILQIELTKIERIYPTQPQPTASEGALGLRDTTKPVDTGGWTEQKERKRKVWTGLAYLGAGGFIVSGLGLYGGIILQKNGSTELTNLKSNNGGQLPTDNAGRDSAIRKYEAGTGILVASIVGLVVFGALWVVGLPKATKLKREKQAAMASRPGLQFTGTGIGGRF